MTWRSGVRFERRGWGFKIDYDKAIAEDDMMIRRAQRSIELGLYQRKLPYLNGSGTFDVLDLWQLVLYGRDVATSLGYSAQDVADLANYVDMDIWAIHPDLPQPQDSRAGYQRGKQILAEIDALCLNCTLYKDEADAKDGLRRAKASRARHVRNKDKYGASASSTAAKP